MGTRPDHLEPGQQIAQPLMVSVRESGQVPAGSSVLLLFERGHWCSVCRRHLATVAENWQQFVDLGIQVVAITHEPAGDPVLLSYPFPVIADADLELAIDFGLVHVDEYGETTIRPSAILVDAHGLITFSYVGDDSRDRPTVAAMLLALRSLEV